MTTCEQRYFLGHSEHELQRLERQGAFLRPATRGLFARAGIRPGMRVLDFGCGAGDVALLAAEMVGPTGEVVGFDRSAEAVGLTAARVAQKGLKNVRVVVGDEGEVAALADGRPFDAVVGRLVLVHVRDVPAVVLHLARYMRPGGVMAFHEIDLEAGHWSSRPNPLLAQLWRWVDGMASRELFAVGMCRRLHEAFDRVEVAERMVVREGRFVKGDDTAALAWVAGFMRSIAQPVQQLGLADASDRPVDELVEKVLRDPAASESYYVPVHMVGASAVVAR